MSGSARFTWQAVPQRLSFFVANTTTQSTISSRGQATPDNQQLTFETSAGADLRLNSFAAQYATIGYEFTRRTRDTVGQDSNRHTGSASYAMPFSETNRIQLNGSISETQYDDPNLDPDLTGYNVNIQYVDTNEDIDFDGKVGASKFDRSGGLEDTDWETTYSLSLTWRVTGVTTMGLSASRSLDDDSLSSTRGLPDFGEEPNENSALSEPVVNTHINATLSTRLGHNDLSLNVFYREQEYETTLPDENSVGASLGLGRNLRRDLRASLYANYDTVNFDFDNRDDDRYRTGLRISWSHWRRLNFNATVGYNWTDSDDPAIEFDEWTATLGLSYRLIPW